MLLSVYDKEGHLCPFDTGLIEKNVLLYVSGYIKAVYEENADIEGTQAQPLINFVSIMIVLH